MSAIFDHGPPPPCPTPFNMAAYVLAGDGAPDGRIAFEVPATRTGPGSTISYGTLRTHVRGIATGLLSHGLRPGDRLLFRLGNRLEFPLAYLAALYVGVIPVPTSAQLTEVEVAALCDICQPHAILTDGATALPQGRALPLITTDRLRDMHALPPAQPVMGDPNRLAYIIFTSGTSGSPKGVCHAHRAIWARRMMHHGWYGLTENDRMLHAGAFNWTYTLGTGLMDPWSVGATALVTPEGTPVSELPEIIAHNNISIFAAAPGVYRQMLRHPFPPRMPALRHGLSAGEQLPATIRAAWEQTTGTAIHEALGMSECSTFISGSPLRPAPEGSSGMPQPGRRVAVLDGDAPAAFDTPGELAVAGSDPGLMLGYLGAQPLTQSWFRTGDMAQMAPDGAITYLGRADDIMNAGGYRVSPLDVEAAMMQAPGLTACAAVEVQATTDTSLIALYHTGDADEQSLRRHAEEKLARYKQPRLYIYAATLPYGPNGKLNRRALRDSYEANHDRNDPA